MSVITLTPRPQRAGARSADIGAVFPQVLEAARCGADWAWTSLHRSVAPPAIGYLRAAGHEDPAGAFSEIFCTFAGDVRWFGGTEADFRLWVFKQAHRRVGSTLGRAATAELTILSRLREGPAIAVAVESEHVDRAIAAATAPPSPGALRRARRRAAMAAPALSVPAVYTALAALPAKAAVASAIVVATAGGVVVADAWSVPPPPAAVQAPADSQAQAGPSPRARGVAADRAATPARAQDGAGTALPGTTSGRADPVAAKQAGLDKAAAAPDNAGEHKDAGLAKAAAAPSSGNRVGDARSRGGGSDAATSDDTRSDKAPAPAVHAEGHARELRTRPVRIPTVPGRGAPPASAG